jgi:hypothetical protein
MSTEGDFEDTIIGSVENWVSIGNGIFVSALACASRMIVCSFVQLVPGGPPGSPPSYQSLPPGSWLVGSEIVSLSDVSVAISLMSSIVTHI